MLTFAVIVLIGTGWSHLKPFLGERDKEIMLLVMLVQLVVNVAIVVVDEMSPGDDGWETWRRGLFILDLFCCALVFLPIAWSVGQIQNASTAVEGKSRTHLIRLTTFQRFYLAVVGYIYFTRIVLSLLASLVSHDLEWIGPVFWEIAAAIFYITTGWLFRPIPRNPYQGISKTEDDADHEEDGIP